MLSSFTSLRHSLRRLAKSPMFTTISLATLAIGIGANTAMFSVIEGVLLKPLPYRESERLVGLWMTAPGINIKEVNMAPSLYFTFSEESRVFEKVSMWQNGSSSVTGISEPEQVQVLSATHQLLPILGIQPALGRGFTAFDDDTKSERTVMLTDGYWKSRFGGDRSVVGRRIMMDGNAREVIGVLPPSFEFMDRKVSMLMPLRFNRAEVRLLNFSYQGVAKLKPGVTLEQANKDLARMFPIAVANFPVNAGFSGNVFEQARIGPNLRFLKADLIGNIGSTLWVLMATVSIVLMIACANTANLLLVRADGRQQELAIRAALGAGWGRIARELLIESVVLGMAGGMLGLGLAYAALRMLVASELAHLPRINSIAIDPLVLAFTLAISLTAGLVFGLAPVFKYARPQLSNALRSGGRSLSASKDRHRARSVLVVVQVALAMVLLVSSGLMIRTFQALRNVDPGFSRANEVQTLRIGIPDTQVKEPELVIRMQEAILRKVEAVGGVSSVALANSAPMDGSSNDPIYASDRTYKAGEIPPIRRFKFISPGYIAALGSRLIAGRELTWGETYNQMPVALVSENLARELWGDARTAVGKRIRPTPKDDWREVIGVVADLRDDGVDQKAPAIAYWPLLQKNFEAEKVNLQRGVALLIRTPRAGSSGLLQELRQAVWSVNPNLPLANVKTLEANYDRSLERTTFTLVMLAISGGMALLLGVVGIYGVISYSVSQRTREIGIRLALGAPPAEIKSMFLRHGLILSGVGAACGLGVAFVLTRLMKSLLYEVSPADPLTYAAVPLGLIVAAALASYLPARRATRVDPMDALRAE